MASVSCHLCCCLAASRAPMPRILHCQLCRWGATAWCDQASRRAAPSAALDLLPAGGARWTSGSKWHARLEGPSPGVVNSTPEKSAPLTHCRQRRFEAYCGLWHATAYNCTQFHFPRGPAAHARLVPPRLVANCIAPCSNPVPTRMTSCLMYAHCMPHSMLCSIFLAI